MSRNSASLTGKLVNADSLRYTPAGIPILEFRLSHSSMQVEGGMERKIEFEIGGIAVADLAIGLSRLQTGKSVNMEGFLARKNPKSGELVFHTTYFELIG